MNVSKLRPGSQKILGLTGSIGMGKSATADMFIKHGIPVHDSDAAVHSLYTSGGAAAKAIGEIFRESLHIDRSIDRDILRKIVLDDTEALRRLEAIVHPLVQKESHAFLTQNIDAPLVVLDIPLLFETEAETRCDAVLVVTAPADVQRRRVLARPGMTETTFVGILAKQMPDAEKRARADFLIDTSLGFVHAESEVAAIIAQLTNSR